MNLIKSIGVAALYFLVMIIGLVVLYLLGSWSIIALAALGGAAIFVTLVWGVYTTKYK